MIRAARLRLTAWYAAIVVAILLVLGTSAYFTMRRTLLSAIDRDLQATVESVGAGDLEVGRALPDRERRVRREHADVFVVVLGVDGRVLSGPSWVEADELIEHHVADGALAGRRDLLTTEIEDEDFRLLAVPLMQDGKVAGAIIGGRSLRAHDRDLRLLLSILAGAGLAGTVLAIAGGYLFAGRSLEPIRLAYERQRRFIGDASHELRSPLAVIRASADLLLREPLAAPQRESAEEIRDTAVEASVLVDDLLALARLDHEPPAAAGERTDVAAVSAEVVGQMRPLLDAHGTAVDLRLVPAVAACPDAAVRRVLRALLENVIAHTPAGTPAAIATALEAGSAVLRVRDHGPGVPAEALEGLFDRFTRVDAARTPGTGSGLGLAIVAALVRRYRGRVEAHTPPGGGLEVEVRLPSG